MLSLVLIPCGTERLCGNNEGTCFFGALPSLEAHFLFYSNDLYIQSFPIPNTKEDVYDFLVLTAGNLNALTLGVSIQSGDGAKEQMDVAAAWYSKLHQCYQKASLLFKDDAELERVRKLCTEAIIFRCPDKWVCGEWEMW